MRRLILSLACYVCAIAGITHAAQTQHTTAYTIDAYAGYASDYLVHGSRLAGCSLQPGAVCTFTHDRNTLITGVDANLPTHTNEKNVLMPKIAYGYAVTPKIQWQLGAIGYLYTQRQNTILKRSSEGYLGLACDLILRPRAHFFYDPKRRQLTFESAFGYFFDFREFGLKNWGLDWDTHFGRVVAYNAYRGTTPYKRGNHYWFFGLRLDLVWQTKIYQLPVALKTGFYYSTNDNRREGFANRFGHHTNTCGWHFVLASHWQKPALP